MFSVISKEAVQDSDPWHNGNTSGESHVHSGFLQEVTFWTTTEESGAQEEQTQHTKLRW